jgi:hypothetical protein
VEVLAAVDDHRLTRDEVGGGHAQEDDGADDVLGHLVSLNRPGGDDASRSFHDLRVRRTPSVIVKPGATQLTWIASLPSSFAKSA